MKSSHCKSKENLFSARFIQLDPNVSKQLIYVEKLTKHS